MTYHHSIHIYNQARDQEDSKTPTRVRMGEATCFADVDFIKYLQLVIFQIGN